MDQNLRASIQASTFYYFMIGVAIVTISQLSTMMVIVFADIEGKENVVAASVIGPCLIGAFGIIRLLTNMTLLVSDMEKSLAIYRDILGLEIVFDKTLPITGNGLPTGIFDAKIPDQNIKGSIQIKNNKITMYIFSEKINE